MIRIFQALLFAGLFFSTLTNAGTWPANIDWAAGTMPSEESYKTICEGAYGEAEFTLDIHGTNADCSKKSNEKYLPIWLAAFNADHGSCPAQVISKSDTGWVIQDRFTMANGGCGTYGSGFGHSVPSRVLRYETAFVCPPKGSGQPVQDAYKAKFKIKAKERKPDGSEGTATLCYKPVDPISCSMMKGFGTTSNDYFITDSPDYKHPSCVTIVSKDKDGNRKAGNCQVIAKSWIQNPASVTDPNFKKWQPLVGTFTGVSCGFDEQVNEPPEEKKPKCWASTNDLKMCQADPYEKCMDVNGVQKCETGCGYVNGDFWCSEKDTSKNPDPAKQDRDPNAPDDTLTNPDKKSADMTKADFKEVNKGIETRITALGTNVANLENSVDQSNTILSEIEFNTAQNLTDNNITNTLLTDIKNTLQDGTGTGGGTGGGDGTGDENGGECLPTDATCNGAGTAGPSSWWTSSYPEGAMGIVNQHKEQFFASEAYSAMKGESLAQGTGAIPVWNMCFDLGFANYGCKELMVPEIVWTFIKAIMLFGAAIYSRQIIIGK